MVDEQGNVKEYYDYYLFGKTLRSQIADQPVATYKFTGKELDDENDLNWYYFGARYYDSNIGRFLSIDRFADKYPSLNPYHYAINNPLIFVDVNGDSIQITDLQTQQDFIRTLPPDAQKYVRFNETGMLDIEYLVSNTKAIKDINLQAAIVVGNANITAFLHATDKIIYADKSGKPVDPIEMGTFFKGFTTAPDGTNMQSAIPGKIDVRINKNISDLKRAEYIGEELYGHARFYIEGKDWEHKIGTGGIDLNRPLFNAIQWHKSRSVINFMRSKRW